MRILWARLHWIRAAATLTSFSALSSGSLIVAIFVVTALRMEAPWVISACFALAILPLILAFLCLMIDIQQSLAALKMELNSRATHWTGSNPSGARPHRAGGT